MGSHPRVAQSESTPDRGPHDPCLAVRRAPGLSSARLSGRRCHRPGYAAAESATMTNSRPDPSEGRMKTRARTGATATRALDDRVALATLSRPRDLAALSATNRHPLRRTCSRHTTSSGAIGSLSASSANRRPWWMPICESASATACRTMSAGSAGRGWQRRSGHHDRSRSMTCRTTLPADDDIADLFDHGAPKNGSSSGRGAGSGTVSRLPASRRPSADGARAA